MQHQQQMPPPAGYPSHAMSTGSNGSSAGGSQQQQHRQPPYYPPPQPPQHGQRPQQQQHQLPQPYYPNNQQPQRFNQHPPMLDTSPTSNNSSMGHGSSHMMTSPHSSRERSALSPTPSNGSSSSTNINMHHNIGQMPPHHQHNQQPYHHPQHPHPSQQQQQRPPQHDASLHGNNIHHPLHPLHNDLDNRSDAEREKDRSLYMDRMQQLWEDQLHEIQHIDFRHFKHNLPLARIKKIMKSDEDVRMISAEAPVVFAKACELFILDLTTKAWQQTYAGKRRTLNRGDVAEAIVASDIFDFLEMVVPRQEDYIAEEAEPWDFETGAVVEGDDGPYDESSYESAPPPPHHSQQYPPHQQSYNDGDQYHQQYPNKSYRATSEVPHTHQPHPMSQQHMQRSMSEEPARWEGQQR